MPTWRALLPRKSHLLLPLLLPVPAATDIRAERPVVGPALTIHIPTSCPHCSIAARLPYHFRRPIDTCTHLARHTASAHRCTLRTRTRLHSTYTPPHARNAAPPPLRWALGGHHLPHHTSHYHLSAGRTIPTPGRWRSVATHLLPARAAPLSAQDHTDGGRRRRDVQLQSGGVLQPTGTACLATTPASTLLRACRAHARCCRLLRRRAFLSSLLLHCIFAFLPGITPRARTALLHLYAAHA